MTGIDLSGEGNFNGEPGSIVRLVLWKQVHSKRAGGYMWTGVLAGSLLTFSIAYLLSPIIDGISSRDAANHGVLALFLCWVLFSILGALVVRFVFRKLR